MATGAFSYKTCPALFFFCYNNYFVLHCCHIHLPCEPVRVATNRIKCCYKYALKLVTVRPLPGQLRSLAWRWLHNFMALKRTVTSRCERGKCNNRQDKLRWSLLFNIYKLCCYTIPYQSYLRVYLLCIQIYCRNNHATKLHKDMNYISCSSWKMGY